MEKFAEDPLEIESPVLRASYHADEMVGDSSCHWDSMG
jgi:hypothetical protein